MAILECIDLSLSYENEQVIKDLSFSLEKGSYLCIIGENGSGKSTLVKAILSLKRPSHGRMILGDGLRENEIGYLPQQTAVQRDFPASVFEVVLSGRASSKTFSPFYSSLDKSMAMEAMERLGIKDLKKRSYRELSGGQQQRVLLARALCATKKLLLLDEPVTGLDPIATNDLYQLISSVNKEGVTVIMVTHDLSSSLKYATHILHLRDGGNVFMTKEEYLASPTGALFTEGGNG